MGVLDGRALALVGIGVMGRWMAAHLAAAGASLVLHNRTRAKAEAAAAPGVTIADTPAEAARGRDMVILMVTDTPAAETALFGRAGIAEGLSAGALVIDMGTTAVAATRGFALRLAERGAGFLDAPVSGGEAAAKSATLTIMVGGNEVDFARAKPVFEVLGRTITHVGGVGAGQVAKAANQAIVALTIAAVAEALTLAKHAGVDPARVREAVRGGFAELAYPRGAWTAHDRGRLRAGRPRENSAQGRGPGARPRPFGRPRIA